ncbi:MAG: oligosaccharide flippase family protein, partial [Chloroflexota bacterium]
MILARGLGPEGKGAFVLVLNLSSLAALVLSLGLERSLAVLAARSLDVARRASANAALWTLVIGGLGVVAIIALYGPRTGDHAPTGLLAPIMPELTPTQLWAGAFALPGEIAFGIGLVGLLGRQRVLAYNVLRFLRRAGLVVLLVAFVIVGRLDLELVLVLNLVALMVAVAGILLAMARAGMIGTRLSPRLLADQLSFGGRTVVGTLAERLHFRANTFLLNAMVGVAATGVFSVALGLAETLWYLPASFGLVLFSRAVRGGREGANIASAMTRTMLALMIVVAVPLWLIAPSAVELVYGAPFREAGVALQIMLPGVLAYSVVAVLSNPIIAWGAPGRLTAVLVTGLAANLAANFTLVPQFGMNRAPAAAQRWRLPGQRRRDSSGPGGAAHGGVQSPRRGNQHDSWRPSGQGRHSALEIAAGDNPRHQPLRLCVDRLDWVDRTVEDPIVADPKPMPRRRSGQGLDVELGFANCQGLERFADPRDRLARTNAPQVTFCSPREDDSTHTGSQSRSSSAKISSAGRARPARRSASAAPLERANTGAWASTKSSSSSGSTAT